MEEKVKLQSVSTEEPVQEQTIATEERINNGFTPQCSATTNSNCSVYNNWGYFQKLARFCDAMRPEPCFQDIDLDSDWTLEMKGLKLTLNQECFVHEVIKQILQFVKEGFENNKNVKIDALIASGYSTIGQIGEFLSLSEKQQNKRPSMKEWCEPWKGLIQSLGKNGNVFLTKCVKDLHIDSDVITYPKGTIIGSIAKDPFPKVSESCAYRELLNPDNYGAPHDVLDFVNKKLHEAYPQFNLWCVALDLECLIIFDLDKLPHMKTY